MSACKEREIVKQSLFRVPCLSQIHTVEVFEDTISGNDEVSLITMPNVLLGKANVKFERSSTRISKNNIDM